MKGRPTSSHRDQGQIEASHTPSPRTVLVEEAAISLQKRTTTDNSHFIMAQIFSKNKLFGIKIFILAWVFIHERGKAERALYYY